MFRAPRGFAMRVWYIFASCEFFVSSQQIACKFASVSTGSKIHGEDTSTRLPVTATPPTIDEEYWSQYATGVAPTIEDSTVEEEANIPCENCGIPFPLSSLELHEVF
jgi:hypothetical protein